MDKYLRLKTETVLNLNEFGGLLYDKQEQKAIIDVLKSGRLFRYADEKGNTESDITESQFSKFFSVKYSILVNSGTSALICALKAFNIKEGDRVLISAYTFVATASAVINAGGIPIPIDFNLETCLDIGDLETEVSKGCIAIIATHLQGRSFDLTKVKEITFKNSIALIEDACQAFGAKINNIYAGTFGDIGVFSFQQNKQITSGEGGLLITNNEDLYFKARNYMDLGAVRNLLPTWDENKACAGENYRCTNLQAALLKIQLNKFENMKERQLKIRKNILNNISSYITESILFRNINDDNGMNIIFFSSKADKIIEFGIKNRILFRRLWSKPYYKNKVFSNLKLDTHNLNKNECIKAIEIADKLVALPINPTIAEKSCSYISNIILSIKDNKLIH